MFGLREDSTKTSYDKNTAVAPGPTPKAQKSVLTVLYVAKLRRDQGRALLATGQIQCIGKAASDHWYSQYEVICKKNKAGFLSSK